MQDVTCVICGKKGGIVGYIFLHSVPKIRWPRLVVSRTFHATCEPCWNHYTYPATHPSRIEHVGNVPSKF
jgi:hypothetical protein